MRARHEHQIKRYLKLFRHGDLERAVYFFGVEWFTEEQIAEIRKTIITIEWSRYRFYRDQRRRAA